MLVVKKISKKFSDSFYKASVIVVLFILSLIIIPFTQEKIAQATSIQDLDNQIKEKKNQAQSLNDEIAGFDKQIQDLANQIQTTQNNVNITNGQIEDTKQKIKDTEEQLRIKKEVLAEYLRVIYEESNTSTLELVASSNSFSDFVDKTEYLQTMQLKIRDTVNQIKQMKSDLDQKRRELENKKSELDSLMSNLSLQNNAVNAQKSAKNDLLNQTNAQINDLAAQREHLIQIYNEQLIGGSNGYPYGNPPLVDQIDTPDDYGYLKGECTSYAAWWRAAHGKPVPRNLGDAKDWASIASNDGPRVGDVMVFPHIAPYGHVAIVTGVNSDGTVSISEYNWPSDTNNHQWYRYNARGNVNPFNYGAVFIH